MLFPSACPCLGTRQVRARANEQTNQEPINHSPQLLTTLHPTLSARSGKRAVHPYPSSSRFQIDRCAPWRHYRCTLFASMHMVSSRQCGLGYRQPTRASGACLRWVDSVCRAYVRAGTKQDRGSVARIAGFGLLYRTSPIRPPRFRGHRALGGRLLRQSLRSASQ